MRVRWASAGRSDVGKVRAHNEDAILLREEIGLWVVADGVGGHTAGDYASGMIVEHLGALSRPDNLFDFVERIEDTLTEINSDLRRSAAARGVDLIGSTIVLLVGDREFLLCGWVGDSRAYCFRDGRLQQITRDHTHGAEHAAGGSDDVPPPSLAAALTRAVGAEERFFVDWVVAESRPGTQFLLCSDGLYREVSDTELDAECRQQRTPKELVDSLLRLALGRGARDNLSAIVVRVAE